MTPQRTLTARYVPLHQAMDYCRMGWQPTCALEGTHHGLYSVAMIWPCECKPPCAIDETTRAEQS